MTGRGIVKRTLSFKGPGRSGEASAAMCEELPAISRHPPQSMTG